MNSEFLSHAPCPKCGSKDNLGVYTDHVFCFGCSFHSGNSNRRISNTNTPKQQDIVTLPFDSETTLPNKATQWLDKYNLSTSDIINNRILWSDKRQLLLFPFFSNGELWGWQGRYFGDDPKHPKWTSKGRHKEIRKLYCQSPYTSSIILVEDIISTIKLSKLTSSICLFGSILSSTDIIYINNTYKPNNIYLWLDYDKRKESYNFCFKYRVLDININPIVTQLDPKEYNLDELRRIIESQTTNHSSSP